MVKYFLGIDVGTGSVRCALVDSTGNIKQVAVRPIQIWSPLDNFYQQSSENIWTACCAACKDVIATNGIDQSLIEGIGFDATCSLVVLDKNFKPLPVNLNSDDVEPIQDIIMWMDHRAVKQADFINTKNYDVLKSVGGKISVEMQPPKLLWLKENMPESWWESAGYFMDLPDYLTWRATKSLTRSLCSITCKWLYSSEEEVGWDRDLWIEIGLEDIIQQNYLTLEPGKACGSGLTPESAQEMGLNGGTAVGASLIDAYAGALGLLACDSGLDEVGDLSNKLAITSGTSTCHIAVSRDAKYVPGVWGPYFSAMIPEFWTNEGGQSVTGKLLDYVITTHPAFYTRSSPEQDLSCFYKELHENLLEMQREQNTPTLAHLTKNFHVYPDFHGNRSPLADSFLTGMVCGLTLNSSIQDLSVYYLATIQALAYSTKQIISAMETAGHSFQCILMCGGLSKNDLYVTTHADVTGLPVIRPNETESVLLGSAMLGAVASGGFSTLEDAMMNMGGKGDVIYPDKETETFHHFKYRVYWKMLNDQREYARLMDYDNGNGEEIRRK